MAESSTPDVTDEDNTAFRVQEKPDRSRTVLSQMSQSSSLTLVYGIILLLAVVIWVALAAKSHYVVSMAMQGDVKKRGKEKITGNLHWYEYRMG